MFKWIVPSHWCASLHAIAYAAVRIHTGIRSPRMPCRPPRPTCTIPSILPTHLGQTELGQYIGALLPTEVCRNADGQCLPNLPAVVVLVVNVVRIPV